MIAARRPLCQDGRGTTQSCRYLQRVRSGECDAEKIVFNARHRDHV